MIPPALRARALAASTAVGDMSADVYCPRRHGERRTNCRYCIAEFTTEAVLDVVAGALDETRTDTLRPFEELFAGGPDTACRTTWREDPTISECSAASIECVEVPMADLRAAFDAAKSTASTPAVSCGLCNSEDSAHQPWCLRVPGVLA